jgi:TrpR-related protein YerC/YecD
MDYKFKVKNSEIDELFQAILHLENMEECYRFFDDLCTVNELEAFGQRLKVAKMISEGKTYHEIEEITGVSAATISKISKSISYGPGGYKLIIEKLKRGN